jgi:dephospho-CoA kinase
VLAVGLTGGLARGKSTAAAALRRLGAPVVSSDELAREVVRPGEPAWQAIRDAFGAAVLRPDGTLDRPRLASLIFADPGARRTLEAITHPEIRRRTLAWLAERRAAGEAAAVCDIPLLFEVGLHRPGTFLDRIWLVYAPPELQLRRLQARDGLDEAAARARLAAQWPMARKLPLADLVLRNEGTPAQLEEAVGAAWRDLLAEAREGTHAP